MGNKNECVVEGTNLRDISEQKGQRTWHLVRGGGSERGKGIKDDLRTLERVRCLLQRPAFRGLIMKLCSVSQSEGTGSSNGRGKIRQQTENGLQSSHEWETSVSVTASLSLYQTAADHDLPDFSSGLRVVSVPSRPRPASESQH